jgi:hypothetical protein
MLNASLRYIVTQSSGDGDSAGGISAAYWALVTSTSTVRLSQEQSTCSRADACQEECHKFERYATSHRQRGNID